MLVLGRVQGLLLHAQRFLLGASLATQRLEIVAALADVAVDLGESVAQLLARLGQSLQGRLRPLLQLGQFAAQDLRLTLRCLGLGT